MNYNDLCENRDMWGDDAGFDVRRFLEHIGSPRLRDVPEFADWVASAAKQSDINPRMLLAVAHKEQSFLTRPGSGSGWQRALDWTMGYGATDGGDIPKYKGTRNQIFSAAAGLRGYWGRGLVQPMVGKTLGRTMPGLSDELTAQVVPANEATAALYLYTPHRSGALGFAQVWTWLEAREAEMGGTTTAPAPAPEPDATRARLIAIAKQVAQARANGVAQVTINGVSFEPLKTGYCAAFVREAHEAALGLPEYTWAYRGASAREVEAKLKAAGKQVAAAQRQAGDVVAFNRAWLGVYGHVAIYMGKDAQGRDMVAEDGSHGVAVNLIGTRAWHISGYYSSLPTATAGYEPGAVKVVLLPGSTVVDCGAALEGDTVRCDLRPLAEALGAEAHDHIVDERKVYLRVPAAAPVTTDQANAKED
jgi:hypothetical protein